MRVGRDLQSKVVPTGWGVTDLPANEMIQQISSYHTHSRPQYIICGYDYCIDSENEAYLDLGSGMVSGLTHTWK